jgi:hypothetical protein
MRLIRERRKRLHLSYDRAGALIPERPISGTRWRQLEDGYRTIKGVRFEEPAPALTLAGMAYVVRVTADELHGFGEHEAAEERTRIAAMYAREDGEALAEARRMVSAVGGLNGRQQEALISDVAQSIRRVREQD